MTTTIDFNSLQAAQGPRVVLMPSTHVGQATVGGVFDDFSAFASVYVTAEANLVNGNRGQPSLTITVEHSDDAMSWSTAATIGYGPDGKHSALVSSPKRYFRVTAAPGGSSVWQVVSVTAAPTYLDPAGGGGGAISVATVTLTNAQIKALPTTPVTVVAAPGAGFELVPIHATLHMDWAADYTNIDAAAQVLVRYDAGQAPLSGLDEAASYTTGVTGLLAEGASTSAFLTPLSYKSSTNKSVALAGQDDAQTENLALTLVADNNGMSDFTGGDAANSLKVTLLYYTVTF